MGQFSMKITPLPGSILGGNQHRGVLPATVKAEIECRLAEQLAGDGSGCLTYELALAETDKLIGEGEDHDGLLSRYRIYLQDRSARAAAFRAQKFS